MTKFILEIRNELSRPEKVCDITFRAEQEFLPEKGTRIPLSQLPLTDNQVKNLTECPSLFQGEDGQYLPLGKVLEGASLCIEKKTRKCGGVWQMLITVPVKPGLEYVPATGNRYPNLIL